MLYNEKYRNTANLLQIGLKVVKMIDNFVDERIEKFNKFINKWTVEKLKIIKLEEYTNSNYDSFVYDIEFDTLELGDIRGNTAFKFGIYKRKDTSEQANKMGRIYTDDYGWYKRYGSNEGIAFENIKAAVNDVISQVQSKNIKAIDKIDLAPLYKWKIAFLFQNKNNIAIIPIFTKNAMRLFLEKNGYYKAGMNMSDMQASIVQSERISTLEDAFHLADIIWDEYINFNILQEKETIKNNKDLTANQRTNATSNLEYIEYEIKAQKVKYRNRHNSLEKSFKKFLELIKVQDIEKDKTYIDFQFIQNNKQYICELKPTDDEKEIKYAVQGAIGQILGYSYNKNYDEKIIVFQNKPSGENLKFLNYLKSQHQISYLYETKEGYFEGNILNC